MRDGAPGGFVYHADVIGDDEERALVGCVAEMALGAVAMRGQVARRRTAHFGWVYGYESWRITPGPPIPDVLLPLRDRVARLAAVAPRALAEVLVTEYPGGAGIGWHRDAPQFGVVIGVSLLGGCRMRFQRSREAAHATRAGAARATRAGAARETRAVSLAPRSAYVLAGEAREQWQHAIPPVRALRYSITFRTLRAPGRPPDQ